MEHTPYGYRIVQGKAVIDDQEAANLRKICENYLSGMSFMKAAADVGIIMKHSGVKHMIQNKRYLGDDFYPAILTEETARRIEEERLRREKALGRDKLCRKEDDAAPIPTSFKMPKVQMKYEDPIKQAEYAYSLIESEVSG